MKAFLPLVLGTCPFHRPQGAAGSPTIPQGKKANRLPLAGRHRRYEHPRISPSGNVHGMPPRRNNMGYGAPELVDLIGFKAQSQPGNIVIVGARDLDAPSENAKSSKQIRHQRSPCATLTSAEWRRSHVRRSQVRHGRHRRHRVSLEWTSSIRRRSGVGTPVRGGVPTARGPLAWN